MWKRLCMLSLIAGCGGMVWFAYHNRYIVITLQYPQQVEQNRMVHKQAVKKKVRFAYWQNSMRAYEWKELLWEEKDIKNATTLLSTYIVLLKDMHMVPVDLHMQLLTTDLQQRVLLCSLNREPWDAQASFFDRWLVIEGFLETIKAYLPRFEYIWFLVHHKIVHKTVFDLSRPIPMTGFTGQWYRDASATQELAAKRAALSEMARARSKKQNKSSQEQDEEYTVILDFAGDAQHTGRMIDNLFERGIALQFVKALKDTLEAQETLSIRVLLTHEAGDLLELLQTASFVNKIKPDILIYMSFFPSKEPVPTLSLYTYSDGSTKSAQGSQRASPLELLAYYEAHHAGKAHTEALAHYLYSYFLQMRPFPATCPHYAQAPYQPLIGMTCPAIACEIGILNRDDWKPLIVPFSEAIIATLKTAS